MDILIQSFHLGDFGINFNIFPGYDNRIIQFTELLHKQSEEHFDPIYFYVYVLLISHDYSAFQTKRKRISVVKF